MTVSPRRLDLLQHLDEVTRWPDGESTRRIRPGRELRVNGDIRWLRDAGLIEIKPGDADLDLQGYRRTDAGEAALR